MSAHKKRGMVPEDILKLRNISDPKISPDGSKVAFVVSEASADYKKINKNIWMTSIRNERPINLTEDNVSSSPRWSPCGKRIAFISVVEGRRRICVMDSDGRNRQEITEFETGNYYYPRTGENIAWSPDGSRIAFIATDDPKKEKGNIIVLDSIQFKALSKYNDGRRNHIFTISPNGGKPEKITSGKYDEHTIFWSPDSSEIGFISNRTGNRDYNNDTQIYAVNISSKKIRQITQNQGTQYTPQWSPDGAMIAYTATSRWQTMKDSVAEDMHVWVINSDGSNGRDLTRVFDRRCYWPNWTRGSNSIIFTAQDQGRMPICVVSPFEGPVKVVVSGNRQVVYRSNPISIALNTNVMVFLMSDPTHPTEIFVSNTDGSSERQVTDLNKPFIEEIQLQEMEHFTFPSFDGVTIHGWIMKPLDYKLGQKYPMILRIHGGPHGMYGWVFRERQQILPTAGYAVLMIDPRGSPGYGQKFSDGSVRDWGGGDYKDLMAGVDYALDAFDFIDRERMGVAGGSYGGYLTNWVITQTDRFKAAVSSASISNIFSMYGNSMKWITIEHEFGGILWDEKVKKLALERSPALFLDSVKTPTLFLHGEVDFTCPVTQAEEMFRGLKRMGVETIMVRYVRSSHGGGWAPELMIDRLKRGLEWMNKYLK
jgi:dipeptidyl aminopeptidase/acylaminoacyl peptidase